MTKQEEVQFKVLALQASAGDIDKAKLVFEWLTEDSVDAEVSRKVEQATKQLELFDGK